MFEENEGAALPRHEKRPFFEGLALIKVGKTLRHRKSEPWMPSDFGNCAARVQWSMSHRSPEVLLDTRTLYHGSRVAVPYPEIRITRFNKDCYFGFYCTERRQQAIRWSTRFTGEGVLNEYLYTPVEGLSVLSFPEMSEEWLDFVVACRNGVPHAYDVVEGPMADDKIFNYIQAYLDGTISRAAFWELARFKHPTHQISFHSARSLACLTFVDGIEVFDEDR